LLIVFVVGWFCFIVLVTYPKIYIYKYIYIYIYDITLAHDPFVCTYNPWSNALMWRKSTSLRVLQPVYEYIQRFNTSNPCQQHDA
jgi:hypothetical protein